MNAHASEHRPVGGPLWTPTFVVLVAIALIGAVFAGIRFVAGLGSVTHLNNGYPWGIWIGFDVVIGTALGCGGYAVALLAYVLNRGKYHPLVRPAVLTSLLGYGFAALAVIVDLGRFWSIWKVPVFFWRWTHSPQLEVALCVMTYVMVLIVEMSPAVLEKAAGSGRPSLAGLARRTRAALERALPFILALGLLLPTMHQSSLGTMMMLTGPRLDPLWQTAWLPFLFLVNCLTIGYAIVILEAHFSSAAFGRPRHTSMLASLSRVAAWVTLFWVAFRVAEVAWSGELVRIFTPLGLAFVGEAGLMAAGALLLHVPRLRAQSPWQLRAAILMLAGACLYRLNTYLIAFHPGDHWSYFPAVPELLVTFGMVAAEVAIYIAAVKTFPILSGAARAPARSPA